MSLVKTYYEFIRVLESKDKVLATEEMKRLIALYSDKDDTYWHRLANYRDFRTGRMLILFAASAGNFDLFWMLYTRGGARVRGKDNGGRNCIHYAATTGALDFITSVHQAFPDLPLYLRDANQQRPEDLAAAFGQHDVVRFLQKRKTELYLKAEGLKNGKFHKAFTEALDDMGPLAEAYLDYTLEKRRDQS